MFQKYDTLGEGEDNKLLTSEVYYAITVKTKRDFLFLLVLSFLLVALVVCTS